MHEPIKKLMAFIDKDETSLNVFPLATETFFRGVHEEYGCASTKEIFDLLGEDATAAAYPVLLEFFFSNVYGEKGDWNVIDRFLASKRSAALSEDERRYLQALRRSVMGLYEVVDVDPDISISLRDMTAKGRKITVKEKTATRSLSKGDRGGFRVLDMGDRFEIAGGALLLEREEAERLAPYLRNMHRATVALACMSVPGEDKTKIEHYAKVMWAAEIAERWMLCHLQRRRQALPDLRNTEGHRISSVTLRFPLRVAPRHEFTKQLTKHKELMKDGDGKNQWAWLDGTGGKRRSAAVRGHIRVTGDELVASVNSRERANILEALLTELLGTQIGKPEIEAANADSGTPEAFLACFSDPDGDEGDMSPEEAAELIYNIKYEHYRKWMRTRIPALDNKTPRMAKRTAKGTRQLALLLRNMQDSEINAAREDGTAPFDMRWMWRELGMTEEAEPAAATGGHAFPSS
jgi:hypothetical protein